MIDKLLFKVKNYLFPAIDRINSIKEEMRNINRNNSNLNDNYDLVYENYVKYRKLESKLYSEVSNYVKHCDLDINKFDYSDIAIVDDIVDKQISIDALNIIEILSCIDAHISINHENIPLCKLSPVNKYVLEKVVREELYNKLTHDSLDDYKPRYVVTSDNKVISNNTSFFADLSILNKDAVVSCVKVNCPAVELLTYIKEVLLDKNKDIISKAFEIISTKPEFELIKAKHGLVLKNVPVTVNGKTTIQKRWVKPFQEDKNKTSKNKFTEEVLSCVSKLSKEGKKRKYDIFTESNGMSEEDTIKTYEKFFKKYGTTFNPVRMFDRCVTHIKELIGDDTQINCEFNDKGFSILAKNTAKNVNISVIRQFVDKSGFKHIDAESDRGIKHSIFSISNAKYQGRGLKQKIFQELNKLYKEMSIEFLTTEASDTCGGYVWSNTGFRCTMEQTKKIINRFKPGTQTCIQKYYLDSDKYRENENGATEILQEDGTYAPVDLVKYQLDIYGNVIDRSKNTYYTITKEDRQRVIDIIEKYKKENPDAKTFPLIDITTDKKLKNASKAALLGLTIKLFVDLKDDENRRDFERAIKYKKKQNISKAEDVVEVERINELDIKYSFRGDSASWVDVQEFDYELQIWNYFVRRTDHRRTLDERIQSVAEQLSHKIDYVKKVISDFDVIEITDGEFRKSIMIINKAIESKSIKQEQLDIIKSKAGLVPVHKLVKNDKGRIYNQIFWVKPEDAIKLRGNLIKKHSNNNNTNIDNKNKNKIYKTLKEGDKVNVTNGDIQHIGCEVVSVDKDNIYVKLKNGQEFKVPGVENSEFDKMNIEYVDKEVEKERLKNVSVVDKINELKELGEKKGYLIFRSYDGHSEPKEDLIDFYKKFNIENADIIKMFDESTKHCKEVFGQESTVLCKFDTNKFEIHVIDYQQKTQAIISRDFYIIKDKLHVNHTYFEIKNIKYQGKGLSKKLFNTFYEQYLNMNIEMINISAGLSAGPTVWPKMGFYANNKTFEKIMKVVNTKQVASTKFHYLQRDPNFESVELDPNTGEKIIKFKDKDTPVKLNSEKIRKLPDELEIGALKAEMFKENLDFLDSKIKEYEGKDNVKARIYKNRNYLLSTEVSNFINRVGIIDTLGDLRVDVENSLKYFNENKEKYYREQNRYNYHDNYLIDTSKTKFNVSKESEVDKIRSSFYEIEKNVRDSGLYTVSKIFENKESMDLLDALFLETKGGYYGINLKDIEQREFFENKIGYEKKQ